MKALLNDILASLKSWGFTQVFNINAHGDGFHIMTGLEAFKEAHRELGINARYMVAEDEVARFGLEGKEDFILVHEVPPIEQAPQNLDIHAGAFETGFVAAYLPNQVDAALARTLAPTRLTTRDLRRWVEDMRSVTPLGYAGDPSGFNSEEAKEHIKARCSMIASSILNSLRQRR
jgi:creatinine amidohydrolase